MAFPCLVNRRFCKTPITVRIDGTEMSEDGELLPVLEIVTTCNLQMGARVSLTKDKEQIELSGVALLIGDICPALPVIASGTATINGREYDINKGTKNYNPDGTVNYTTLELI